MEINKECDFSISVSMPKKVLFITLIFFALFSYVDEFFFRSIRQGLDEVLHQRGISHLIAYTLVGIPVFAGLFLLHKKRGFLDSLGLNKSALQGIVFALLCTLPMFIGCAFFFDFNGNLTLNLILINAVAAGFFEELYFRGFLFGQIYRYTRIGFLIWVLVAALFYSLAHIFLGSDLMEIILIFLIAFFGGLIFSWFYVEWNYNLWVPIFLHTLINLSWEMFAISEHPAGDAYANYFRLFTVLLAVGLTLLYKRRKGIPLEVTWRRLFMKGRSLVPVV